MSGKGLDSRRLKSLAAAARKAGITRLRLADGTEFDIPPLPVEPAPPPSKARLAPPPPVEDAPAPGSTAWVLNRFSKASKGKGN